METDLGDTYYYEKDCKDFATHDIECDQAADAGYFVIVSTVLHCAVCIAIFVLSFVPKWAGYAWYAVYYCIVMEVLQICVWSLVFPFR